MKARVIAIMLVMGTSAFAGNSDIGSSDSGTVIRSVGRGELAYTKMEYCERRYSRRGDRVDPFALSVKESLALVEVTSPVVTFTGKALEAPSIVYTGHKGEFETTELYYYASLAVRSDRATVDRAEYGPGWLEGYQMIDEKAFSVEGSKLVYMANGKKTEVADLRGGRTETDGNYDNYCKVISNAHNLFKLKIVKGKLSFFQRIPGCTAPLICTEISAEREPRKIKVQLK